MFVCLDLAITVNFKISEFHLHVHNNIQIQRILALCTSSMQGIVNRLATCSTDDGDNKDGETTCGHWLEHHEHSASLVATLTKTGTVRGPTAMAGDVAARLFQL